MTVRVFREAFGGGVGARATGALRDRWLTAWQWLRLEALLWVMWIAGIS